MQEPTRADRPPRVLADRYELRRPVGHGGMAEVWCAHDLLLGRTVAVKLFRSGTGHGARQRAEAVLLASLSHPGLVTVFDAVLPDDPSGGESFLVTEFVEGPNLRERLDGSSGHPMRPREVAGLGAQLADALGYVHASGIVHRDVKPANVLLAPAEPADGAGGLPRAKLADFGVALLADGGDRLTEDGTVVGTPNYLSPEQLTGARVGPPSDVYSLGLVLLECLSGALTYPGRGLEAALARLHNVPELPAHLDPAWRDLLAAMVSNDPAARPTAAQAADRLHALGGAETFPAVPDRAAVPDPTAVPGPTVVLAAASPLAASRALSASGPATRVVGPHPRRRRLLPTAIVAAVVLAVVLAVIFSGGTAGPGHPEPAADYPSVSGQLGRDLAVLQRDVRPDGQMLRADVLDLTEAAATGQLAAARAALNNLSQDVAAAAAAGQLTPAAAQQLRRDTAAVSADLAQAASRAASASRAAASRARASRAAAAAKASRAARASQLAKASRAAKAAQPPAAPPKPGHGHGHGPGGPPGHSG